MNPASHLLTETIDSQAEPAKVFALSLRKLQQRNSLSRAEARALVDAMLSEAASDAQIAAALTALTLKGETPEELAGMAEAMRARATRIESRHALVLDTAGTGAGATKTFNVSTAAAFVIAGAGVPMAKHGNRAVTSRSGSADVLQALGVRIDVPAEISTACLDDFGICFLFAPLYHSATARVASVRRQLGFRTAFNLLGPLTNPAGARRQVVGVSHPAAVNLVAGALAALGTERAWVVHGEDGLDEVTIGGRTRIAEVLYGRLVTSDLSPADFGFELMKLDEARGGDASENASIIRDLLEGRRHGAARALVIMNAASALVVAGVAGGPRDGARLAAASLDSGAALGKLEALIQATTAHANGVTG